MFCLSNKDEFQCKSDECIKWSYVCDGISHCSNKADEDCDMCTNDLYLCKDSSRINCTLACSTLGYIPCKNYVDKKICASVNKKSSSSNLLNKHGDLDDEFFADKSSFFRNLPSNEKFLFTGVFIFVSFITIFTLFGVFYNRYKQKKRRFSSSVLDNSITNNTSTTNPTNHQLTQSNNLRSQSLSITTSLSNNSQDQIYFDDLNINCIFDGKKYTKVFSKADNNNLLKSSQPYQSQLSASNEYIVKNCQANSADKNSDTKQVLSEISADFEIIDYQLYGEPPPSYKLSKYYPKASTIKPEIKSTIDPLLKKTDSLEDDNCSHIYENLDEVSSVSDTTKGDDIRRSKNKDTNSQIKQQSLNNKRARFQALKKNSSLNSSVKKNSRNSNCLNRSEPHSEQILETNLEQNQIKFSVLSSSSSASSTSSSLTFPKNKLNNNNNNEELKSNQKLVQYQMQKNQINKSTSEQFL